MPQGYDLDPVAGEFLSDSSRESPPEMQANAYPGTPLWVKAFIAVAVVSLLIFAATHLAGRGLGGHMHAPPPSSGSAP